jgi:hypothetical protein
MVNGVLVERTVEDVLPTLKTNSDGLKQVLEDMLKQYKSKQTELDSWKVSSDRIYQRHMPRVLLEYALSTGTFNSRPVILTFLALTEEEQHSGCAALKEICHGVTF